MPLYCAGRRTAPFRAAFAAILLSGCAALPNQQEAQSKDEPEPAPEAQAPTDNQGGVTSAPVIRDVARAEPATSAWTFLERALSAKNSQAQLLFLASAQRFLQTTRLEEAKVVLNRAQFQSAGPWIVRQHTLMRAALALAEEDSSKTRRLLARVEDGELDNSQWLLLNDLKLQSLFAEEKHVEALNLINRISFNGRTGSDVDILLHRVFNALSMLSFDELGLLKQQPDMTKDDIAWIDLAQVSSDAAWQLEALRRDLDNWSADYPGHRATAIATALRPALCASPSPASIALLLPMTSPFTKAASAFHDGFMHLHDGDRPASRPLVSLYDFGEDTESIGDVYRTAVEAGADLVIGPLGRDAVSNLMAHSTMTVPTLLLGSDNTPKAPNAFFVDLSRRSEAQSLVTHARSRGLKHALVLYTLTQATKAAADAATQAWQDQGGIITDTVIVDSTRSDFSEMISRMLGLSQAEEQTKTLQSVLTDALPITVLPRIRQDLDVIFLFADQNTARLLKPQIDFHHAGKLPIYSQNAVFTGTPDPVNDLDLEGILFSDMPWFVRRTGRFERSDNTLTGTARYQGSGIDRLFALGMDAYRLGCQIPKSPANSAWRYVGASGTFSLQNDGIIQRHPDWVIFRQGIPELFAPVIAR
tara:strand:- start:505 stop:2439 length:1935 start_codon:yes stop_codon:yes gene_type:complete